MTNENIAGQVRDTRVYRRVLIALDHYLVVSVINALKELETLSKFTNIQKGEHVIKSIY